MRTIIIGGGFAGLSAMKVNKSLLIDEKDYFTLTHKLVDVFKTGNPNLAKIPYREGNFLRARVREIDFRRNKVITEMGAFDYDKLLIAAGYSQKIFPNTLKIENIDDALNLRQRVMKGKKVTILGGGLLGVELASACKEMGKEVSLVEGQNKLLGFMTKESSQFALNKLSEIGVKVLLNQKVEGIENGKVKTNDYELESDVVISSVGFRGPSLVQEMGLTNVNGRMLVDDYLRSVDYENVYGAGDSATTKGFVPMSAQVAVQAGKTAMENMLREPRKFTYKQVAIIVKINGEYFGDLMGRFVRGKVAEMAEKIGIAKAVMLVN